jgi:Fe-S oxidoreductase
MGPYVMLALIVVAWSAFGWQAARRFKLLRAGQPAPRFDRLGERLRGTWRWAFRQERMDYYQPSGAAHELIFVGFMVLLLRTLMLWGRGFSPTFNLWVFAPWMPAGRVYEFAKDCVATLVVAGCLVFFYYRLIKPLKRTTHSFEAIVILGIISTMMIADMTYDGASHVLLMRKVEMCGMGKASLATASQCDAIRAIVAPLGEQIDGPQNKIEWSPYPSPAGTLFAVMFRALGPSALVALARAGFWTHATLVLLFLNLLPRSKHFHVITAIPNVFFRSLDPAGRLRPIDNLMGKMEEATGLEDPAAAPIGLSRLEHLTWKSILDFYTCTECGRCSENCPAHRTGKILSPKHLTLDLRNHLYKREEEMLAGGKHEPINLAPDVIHPDVLWACTTCRACEEQCPVFISYVDKIVDMRRNLMMIRNEFPAELAKAFQGMEVNGNPWNVSRIDRAGWADGLDIPFMADKPDAAVLYWVGCAAATDDRAKKIARAVAKLLKQAKVDFAILGKEESCTGDPARRAGHEMLFTQLAEGNATTLNGYKEKGGIKTVVTACPHCFNTLKNEYPDFGCKLEVVHHTDYLLGLLAEKKLVPSNEVVGRVVYHDSCYLGRYNGVYESPREILKRIPGVDLVEVPYWSKQRGLCCGAGGAQYFMEEQNKDRVNVKRTLQLVATEAKTIASACPFCSSMVNDGLKSQNLEEQIKQLDVAELLEQACAEKAVSGAVTAAEVVPPPAEPQDIGQAEA